MCDPLQHEEQGSLSMTRSFTRHSTRPLSITGTVARLTRSVSGDEDRQQVHTGVVARTLELSNGRVTEQIKGATQWLEALLKHIDPARERFLIRIPFTAGDSVTVLVITRQSTREALEARRAELALGLDAALTAALVGVRVVAAAGDEAELRPSETALEILPDGLRVDADSFKTLVPRALAAVDTSEAAGPDEVTSGVWVARDPGRRADLAAIGRLLDLPPLSGAVLFIEVERFKRDPALERLLRKTYQPLSDALAKNTATDLMAKDGFGQALMAHLAWLNAPVCQRVTAWLDAPEQMSPVLAEMVCQAIYGVPLADGKPQGYVDLSRALPDCNLGWLERLPYLLATQRQRALRSRLMSTTAGGLRLGQSEDGNAVHLSDTARQQHAFILGQTGTGKSTFIANLIRQDILAGEAVLLIDAHGDLARDALGLVPPARKKDLIYVHPTEPAGRFTLNIFESLGDKTEIEHERAASDLINLFKRIYPEPKEAFGPMFMQYMRNAIFLLLSAEGEAANVLQIGRVFSEPRYRRELVEKCRREDMKTFWGRIAENINDCGENASINNVAPYIMAKLTNLSGSEVLAPIIGATTTSLDFRKVVEDKRICIINLDLPGIGDECAKILGGLLFARLSAYLQVQAKRAPKARIPLRVYLDEVQTYADESLSHGMAQMRKFGLTYTLACQHLNQLDGSGWRPEVCRAIIGNVASLVLFRLGYFDAQMLAPYMMPTIAADELMRLPNYHAATRLISDGGHTIDPIMFKSDTPCWG